MNIKKIVVAGLAGGILDWILGAIFWGALGATLFETPQPSDMNMTLITFGCFTIGFLIAYICIGLANITTAVAGIKVGAVLGLFNSLMANLFTYAYDASKISIHDFIMDIIVQIICFSLVAALVAYINGKMK